MAVIFHISFLLIAIIKFGVANEVYFGAKGSTLHELHENVRALSERLQKECPHLIDEEPIVKTRSLDEKSVSEVVQIEIENRTYEHLKELSQKCFLGMIIKKPVVSTKQPRMIPPQCISSTTRNLTEEWRKEYPRKDRVNSDVGVLDQGKTWFRFTGDAGNKLRSTCPEQFSCGSTAAYWSDDLMPANFGETVSFKMYESWSDGLTSEKCKVSSTDARVTRCSSAEDYVYKIEGKMGKGLDTICGMK